MKGFVYLFFCCLMSAGISSAQSISINDETPKISVSDLKWEGRTQFPPPTSMVLPNIDQGSIRPANPIPPGGLKRYFVYQAKFTNNGEKKVRGIFSEYVFVDPINNQEIGRHRMMNYAKIGKNKSL